MARTNEDWLSIGTLTAPWGLRGEIKLFFDADIALVRQLKRIYLGAERRPAEIEAVYQRGRFYTLKLQGIDSATAAEALRNVEIGVPRSEAPALPEGHFFVEDIIGLRVVMSDGRDIGPIVQVLATGANDVYVVRGQEREILIPAIRDVVVSIDIADGVVRIEPMPGLLDE